MSHVKRKFVFVIGYNPSIQLLTEGATLDDFSGQFFRIFALLLLYVT